MHRTRLIPLLALFAIPAMMGADEGSCVPRTPLGEDLMICGDGIVEGDEECDGDAFGGLTCTELDYSAGELVCGVDCRIDDSGCFDAECVPGDVADCVCPDSGIVGTRTCVDGEWLECECGEPGEICDNGIDDDGDGLIDCGDPNCAISPDCESMCGNGICEPGEAADLCPTDCGVCVDGEVADCVCPDSGIVGTRTCVDGEWLECECGEPGEICDNGIDDDSDGLIDCGDPNCAISPDCESMCGNGICEPGEAADLCPTDCGICGDGEVVNCVCPDSGIEGTRTCVDGEWLECECGEPGEICDNGIDDDGDGFFDCEDPNCAISPDCESMCGNGICEPGEAADLCPTDCGICGDGEVVNCVCPDSGIEGTRTCVDGEWLECECGEPGEICDNGIDDDGDGFFDCDDFDCAAAPACL